MNPPIRLRGAYYLLLLVVVCATPFALAQRDATKQSVAKPVTTIPVTNTNDSGSGPLRNALAIANGGGDPTGMYVDDLALYEPCATHQGILKKK